MHHKACSKPKQGRGTLRCAMSWRSLAVILGWTMKWTFLSRAGLCCVRMTLKFCRNTDAASSVRQGEAHVTVWVCGYHHRTWR